MKFRHALLAALLSLSFVMPAMTRMLQEAQADEEVPTPAPELKPVDHTPRKPKTPGALRLYLLDGAVLTGDLAIKEFTVKTQFGDLKVPVTEVLGFTPGLDSHPKLNARLNELIQQLGSADFAEREAAQKELQGMGGAIRGELEKFAKDEDAERRTRVQALLDEMTAMIDQEDPDMAGADKLIKEDTLITPQFTIVGRIQPESFSLNSSYGVLTVKLSDIRDARRDGGVEEEIRKTIDVQGQNLAMTNWKDSKIRLEKGDTVSITADGSITLSPWGSRAMSTPEGAANYGTMQPGNFPLGTLVGRIGDGQPFKIGSKSNFTADRSGSLQLGMAMMPDYANNAFPGQYNVKIRVQKK